MNNEYIRLWVELRPQEDTPADPRSRDPRWHGLASPVMRRALGNALVKIFCPYGEPRCQPRGGGKAQATELCQLATLCPYGILYAHSLNPRPPLALYVPDKFARGEAGVEVTLFGAACGLYGWVLQALERACRMGLGKSRMRWELEEILWIHPNRTRERICGGELRDLSPLLPPQRLELAACSEGSAGVEAGRVEVVLESPARLIKQGRLLPGSEPVPFDLLIARILDRFAALFGKDADPWLEPGVRRQLEEEARGVSLLEDETRWLEVEDYSARSGSELFMGGKVGRLVYDSAALRLLPILRAGEILHVGKNPGFGCGRLVVAVLE